MRGLILVALILVLVTVSCGSDEPTSPSSTAGQEQHQMGSESSDFDFGQPGDAAESDRKVTVLALDSLRFDPESVDVGAGDTITFVITNEGEDLHEFVLGDRDFQEEHAQDMEEDHSMEEGSNVVEIEPGATETITWTFSGSDEVLFACHEPGHYEGGMIGTVTVEK